MTDREEQDPQADALSLSEQDYQSWKKNAPLLYDTLISHTLEYPVQSLELLKAKTEKPDEGFYFQQAILGFNSTEGDSLQLYNIRLPSEKSGGKGGVFAPGFKCIVPEKKFDHKGAVNILKTNNSHIATSSSDSNIYIFEKEKGLIEKLEGAKEEGFGLDWDASSNKLVSGHNDGFVYLWDMAGKPKRVSSFECHRGVNSVQFHKQNPRIFATAGEDCCVSLFDLRHSSNSPFVILTAHTREVLSLDFAFQSEYTFLSGSNDGEIKLWDMRWLLEDLHEFEGMNSAITKLAWHPNLEAIFAAGGQEKRIVIFNCAKIGDDVEGDGEEGEGGPEVVFQHRGHRGGVTDFCWNGSSEFGIMSADDENYVHFWEVDGSVY